MGISDGAVKDAESQADGGETIVAATEAPERFSEIMDRALGGERFQVTRYGKPKVYILGARDYDKLRELERNAAREK
jgi:prevent-host-death family protein